MAGESLTWDLLPQGVQSKLTALRDKANDLSGRMPQTMPADPRASPHAARATKPHPLAGMGAGDAAQAAASFVTPSEAWEVPFMVAPWLKGTMKAAVPVAGALYAGDADASPLRVLRETATRFGARSREFQEAAQATARLTNSPSERARILSYASEMTKKPAFSRSEALRQEREIGSWLPAQHVVPERIIKPEELQGSVIVPLVGDTTGTHTVKVGGRNVRQEGGAEYARTPGAKASGTAWLSRGTAGSKHQNAVDAAAAANPGAPVFGAHVAMGPAGSDFAAHTMDTWLALLRDQPNFNAKAFDDPVREFFANSPLKAHRAFGQEYTSILDPSVQERLLDPAAGNLRTGVLDRARLPGLQKEANLPPIAQLDNAVVEQDLLHEFPGATGRTIMRMEPGAETRPVGPDVHRTYDRGPSGEYEGRLEFPVPYDLLFGPVKDTGYAAVQRAMMMNPAISAKVTPEVVDNISRYMELQRQLRGDK